MKIQILYKEFTGNSKIQVFCDVETMIERRDESGSRPKIVKTQKVDEKGYPYSCIDVSENGVAELEVTPKNMKTLQTLILDEKFELYYPEDEASLYRFGDFREQILDEIEEQYEKAKKQRELNRKGGSIALETPEQFLARKRAELKGIAKIDKPKAVRRRLTDDEKAEKSKILAQARLEKAKLKIKRENEPVEV